MTKLPNPFRTLLIVAALGWGISTASAVTTPYVITSGGTETFRIKWDTHTGFAQAGALVLTKVSGVGPSPVVTVCTDVGGTLIGSDTYYYDQPDVFNNHDGIRPTWGSGNQNSPPNPINLASASA